MEETQIKLVVQKSNYDLEITDELEQKIRHLCSKFPQREWSGVLFYEYTGAFSDNSIKFIAKDLLFMDEGDATSTEFDLDSPDVVGYMCDNDLFGCQTALIHSHQNMQAFFSGQDDSTLKQEGAKRNHFLSLVVNNAGKYVARITSKETYKYTIKGTSVFKTFNDVSATKEVNEDREQVVIMAYDLNIIMPEISNKFKDLDDRIEECKKKKEEKEEKKKNEYQKSSQQLLPFNYSSNWQESYKPVAQEIKEIVKPVNTGDNNREISIMEESILTEDILTEEDCANYAAQLILLNPLAKEKDIEPFLDVMCDEIEERFATIDDYQSFLNLIIDEVIDFELGCLLLTSISEEENVDTCLVNARMQIAAYIEEVTKFNKNDYIGIILKKLYA